MAGPRYPTGSDNDRPLGLLLRHATGSTIVLFFLLVLALSLAPLPDWARPIDGLSSAEGWRDLSAVLLRRGAAAPRKGDTAAHDWAAEEEAAPEEEEGPKPEAEIELEAVAPAPARSRWQPPPRPRLEQYRARLGLRASPVEIPCTSSTAGRCAARGLDRFFAGLEDSLARKPAGQVRVVHYGDSIIASDHITDVVRLRLQERFGSAGKGFLLPTRYNERQRRLRAGDGSKGWLAEHIAQGELKDRHFGYAGAAFTAERAGEETVFGDLGKNSRLDLFYLAQPAGGVIELYADEARIGEVETQATAPEARFFAATVPPGTQRLKVRAMARGIRLFGVALEAAAPGVVYESIGVPGSTAEVWLYPDEAGFQRQLSHRKPALIVTMLGGNDARTLHQRRTTTGEIEEHTRAMTARLRRAAPGADCLIVSPLDAVLAKASGEMRSKPEVPIVIEIQRKVARELGCAFWSMYDSMGGKGSLERWYKAQLINPDLIHPRGPGGDLLGELMAEALMNAFDDRPSDALTVSKDP